MRKDCPVAQVLTVDAIYQRARILFESPSVVMVSYMTRNFDNPKSTPAERVDTISKGDILSIRRYQN